jgi:hypothetical protein
VDIVRGLRELELRKSPSISETIDWARTLAVLGVQELNATILADTASVVVKYDKDVRKAITAMPRLVDPNATVAETGHGHGHGHGHDGNGGHDGDIHDGDTHDVDDGPRVRAAKDRVGRHGEGYGNPVQPARPAAEDPPPKPRGVTSSQGSRSFGLGRKRAL